MWSHDKRCRAVGIPSHHHITLAPATSALSCRNHFCLPLPNMGSSLKLTGAYCLYRSAGPYQGLFQLGTTVSCLVLRSFAKGRRAGQIIPKTDHSFLGECIRWVFFSGFTFLLALCVLIVNLLTEHFNSQAGSRSQKLGKE